MESNCSDREGKVSCAREGKLQSTCGQDTSLHQSVKVFNIINLQLTVKMKLVHFRWKVRTTCGVCLQHGFSNPGLSDET